MFLKISRMNDADNQTNEIMLINYKSPYVSYDLYVEISSNILMYRYLEAFLLTH